MTTWQHDQITSVWGEQVFKEDADSECHEGALSVDRRVWPRSRSIFMPDHRISAWRDDRAAGPHDNDVATKKREDVGQDALVYEVVEEHRPFIDEWAKVSAHGELEGVERLIRGGDLVA
jgi:hypothetical protein